MKGTWLFGLFLLAFAFTSGCEELPQETPKGKGMTEANMERRPLDAKSDTSDWTNGSPDETTLSRSSKQTRGERPSFLFANVVDYTKGEKNYPIGWPRTSLSMAKLNLTDWSAYDFFECWIYAETSRDSLPAAPVGIGFSHTSHKRSTGLELKEVKKDEWVRITMPISKLMDPKDVQGIQFHISESRYRHGDRVNFYIADMALVRFVEPTVTALALDRAIQYSNTPNITALYSLSGYKGMDDIQVELAVGRGNAVPVAKTLAKGARKGEITLAPAQPLAPGTYWARLNLRDANGGLVDRKEAEFRVIAGPF